MVNLKDSFLTQQDIDIILALKDCTPKLAALRLGIKRHVIYDHTKKIRRIRKKCRVTLNQIVAYEKMSYRLRRSLTPKD